MSLHKLNEINLGDSSNELLFYSPLNIQIFMLSLEKFCNKWHVSKNKMVTKISKFDLFKRVTKLFISLVIILQSFPLIYYLLNSDKTVDFQLPMIIIYSLIASIIYAFVYRKELTRIPYIKFTEYESGTLLLITVKNIKNETLISKDNLYKLLMYISSPSSPSGDNNQVTPINSVYIRSD